MSRPDPFVHRRVVAFSETDAAGIVHFAVLFTYMEDCEHALMRSLGRTVHHNEHDGDFLGFPRVSASAHFLHPLKFEEAVEVRAWVTRIGRSSLRYRFEIARGTDGTLAAEGEMVAVQTARKGGVLQSVPIDDELRGELGRWLAPENMEPTAH